MRIGGGIYNAGTLTLKDGGNVSENTATEQGGGIVNFGTVTLQAGSSVTANTAGSGGGIYNWYGSTTLAAGSSVTGNTAQAGGGIFNDPNPQYPNVVTLAATDIVTLNYLLDETTVSNCAPVDTIPNCLG